MGMIAQQWEETEMSKTISSVWYGMTAPCWVSVGTSWLTYLLMYFLTYLLIIPSGVQATDCLFPSSAVLCCWLG